MTSHTTPPSSATRRLEEWLQQHLGGRVTRIDQEGRWRPSWRATVERGDGAASVYIRGDRGHGYSYPLAYEAGVLRVLEASGVPVPHVYGMCGDPAAIVMDYVPGTRQLTGVDDPGARRRILDDYITALVAVHAIDIRQFDEAGLVCHAGSPGRPIDLRRDRERVYREHLKSRPEPFVEFVLAWLERNQPRHRTQRCFVTFDAGQFLVNEGRLVALYDFELAHINDPLADLGGLRVRNVFEPLGDLGYLYRRYADLTGVDLDFDVINYHAMVLALAANEAIAGAITRPLPDAIVWLAWEVSGALITMSAMADILGVDLESADEHVPERPARSPATEAMAAAVAALPPGAGDGYQHGLAMGLARHLRLVERYGESLDAADLDDVASVIGRRPATVADADRELERFVRTAGPDRDADLLQLFHRRIGRKRMLLPEFDPVAAPAGDVSPHLDRCHLPRLRDVMARYDAAAGR